MTGDLQVSQAYGFIGILGHAELTVINDVYIMNIVPGNRNIPVLVNIL
jgi:hypothetical protein